MSGREETDAQVVRRSLRRFERRATELSEGGQAFEPVTETAEFPDGPLVVTIAAERGQTTIAFHTPDEQETIVMSLEQLRTRIAQL